MKVGLLLISLLLLTLCTNLRAQEVDSWVVFDSNGEVVDNVEIPAEEEDDFFDEKLSMPGQLAEDDDFDENIHLANWGNFLNGAKNITGKGKGFEKAVVTLEFKLPQGYYIEMCSGAMVGPDLVLTTAHCFVEAMAYKLPLRVVAVGMPKTEGRYLMANATKYWLPEEYTLAFEENGYMEEFHEEGAAQYDYGFIRLDKNIGEQTGYFGVTAASPKKHAPGTMIHVLGHQGNEKDNTLWKVPGTITKYYKAFLGHNAYIERKMCGGPTITRNNPSQIIGIMLASQVSSSISDVLSPYSISLKITPSIVRMVLNLRKTSAPQQPAKKKKKNRSI